MSKSSAYSKSESNLLALLIGCLCGILIWFVGLVGLAVCIMYEYLTFSSTKYLVPIVQFLSAFISVYSIGKSTQNNRIILLALLIHIVLQFSVAVLFYNGLTAYAFVNLALIAAGAVAGFVVVNKRNSFKTVRYKRKRN